ncbi:hypothetical protein B5807_11121 [Epicoccum nigrum]|jgi:hypothetical protein|uniref:Uncharacterized protein n=1 Tax=Epicoccum nigrum TaxID=105696 RepID=A0A1Y2LL22_EPING|nr:hypothetical protein B5807_11121 [Epicoccum nigrum]
MCVFTYTHLDCGHRLQDHIDTGSCNYFEHTGVHCQPDSRQHRERGTQVLTRKRSGECADCRQKIQDGWDASELAAAVKASLAAAEKERMSQLKREQRYREDVERADQAEKARLARDRARLAQEDNDREAEREKRRKEERRARKEAEKEKKRQEELRLADKEARRLRRADERRRENEAAEMQARRAELEQAEHERKLQMRREEEAWYREREEAEHQQRLQAEKDQLKARQVREETEALERQRAAEAQREAALKLQLQQLQDEEARRHLTAEQDAARRAQEELAAKKAANDAMERTLLARAIDQISPSSTPPPPTPAPSSKPVVLDPASLIGTHAPAEYGHMRIGNRPVPLHPSQKHAHQLSSNPATPSTGRMPLTPMARLGGTITASPTAYTVHAPNAVGTPTTAGATPEWKRSLLSRTNSWKGESAGSPVPMSTSTSRGEKGPEEELRARLEKRRAWEVEVEREQTAQTQAAQQVREAAREEDSESESESESEVSSDEESEASDWDRETTIPAPPRAPAARTQAPAPSHPSPTYPPVPPLAHPRLSSTSPSSASPSTATAVHRPRPPIPVKRLSSTNNTPQLTGKGGAAGVPLAPPLPAFNKTHARVDSAAASPALGMEGSPRAVGDAFGEQRRRGWKAE